MQHVPLLVELYGKLADPCGRSITIAIPADGCAAAELRQLAGANNPALATQLASTRVRLCINDRLARDEDLVHAGDSVALMPPVSGG